MAKPPNKPTPHHAQPLMTVKDVARADNVSEKTVRRAINAGLLEVIRVGPGGRLIRISPAAHAAYRMVQTGDH
ncbi:helix-turn-helix domain-containing protein [Roseovarius pacificus]|uniref:helix-turn-helix domain-containing protein n=1 Tax=Roseovarius pacificus TaxID=337701 RepID=UPI0040396FF7